MSDEALPQRRYTIDAAGVRLALYEWGDRTAEPVFLCHGTMEFALTFADLACRLAARGHRVVAWDQRGHGDSDRTQLYSWSADLRDAIGVLDAVAGSTPAALIGHSKGGALVTALASAAPGRVRAVVNVEGFQSQESQPLPDDMDRWARVWLDHRRQLGQADRRGRPADELVARRARSNPRVPPETIRRFVEWGTEPAPGGLRWKIDPAIRLGAYWPRRPDWPPSTVSGLPCPFLAVVARILEPLARGARPQDVAKQLPLGGHMQVIDSGHFVHLERPDELTDAIGEFLDRLTAAAA